MRQAIKEVEKAKKRVAKEEKAVAKDVEEQQALLDKLDEGTRVAWHIHQLEKDSDNGSEQGDITGGLAVIYDVVLLSLNAYEHDPDYDIVKPKQNKAAVVTAQLEKEIEEKEK